MKKPARGFTLIETLVYLALFAIVTGGMLTAVYALFESADRNQTKAMLQQEENFLIGKIDWALSGDAIITDPTANVSGDVLTVTKYDDTIITVTRSGTNVTLNGAILNNSNVTVSHLVFIHTYAGGTNPDGIEAGFMISAKTGSGMTISEIASTTGFLQQ